MRSAIFVFRRDLRIHDNHALNELGRGGKTCVMPVFLMDPDQVTRNDHNRYYFSHNALQYMCESLVDLDNDLHAKYGSRLRILYGSPTETLEQCIKGLRPDCVAWNADYSKRALERDRRLREICEERGVQVVVSDSDMSLHPVAELGKADGQPYRQFSSFLKHARALGAPRAPARLHNVTFFPGKGPLVLPISYPSRSLAQRGGRREALRALARSRGLRDYDKTRNLLAHPTSQLSGALNFGCLSVREVCEQSELSSAFAEQLYWRDFFLQLAALDPRSRSFRRHMDTSFDRIRWRTNEEVIKREVEKLWSCRTGFLLVDAGMSEMLKTGFMHNRARMLVGNFWTKYLRIHILHPRFGSQVGFSSQLLDAVGPSQNKLNHHWITELDYAGRRYAPKGNALAGRPMDISNKMIRKFDPTGAYIKRWLPHLARFTVKELVAWRGDGGSHPGPMFDARERYQEWVEACRGASRKK